MLQLMHMDRVDFKRDVIDCANSVASAFGPSWANRAAFVVLSLRELPSEWRVDARTWLFRSLLRVTRD